MAMWERTGAKLSSRQSYQMLKFSSHYYRKTEDKRSPVSYKKATPEVQTRTDGGLDEGVVYEGVCLRYLKVK